MKKAGLIDIRRDQIGNVIGVLKGGAGPAVVFAAQTDTAFPAGTPLKVRREGDTLFAPGVGDNSAGCANMPQAIRAITKAELRFARDLIFVGTVQEEVGLNGMRYFLENNRDKAGMLVALDGDLGTIFYGALTRSCRRAWTCKHYLLKEGYPEVKVRAAGSGSSDGNVGVEMGIPTITAGRSFGKNQHTLQESAQIEPTVIGTNRSSCSPSFWAASIRRAD